MAKIDELSGILKSPAKIKAVMKKNSFGLKKFTAMTAAPKFMSIKSARSPKPT